MTDVPFETRRLLRDLPDLLAGKEPVLTSDRGREHLHRDPVARGLFVTALEIGAALEGGAYARIPRRRVAPEILTSVDRARRFFRRRLVEVGQHVGVAEFHRSRSPEDPFFENAEYAVAKPKEASSLRSMAETLGVVFTEADPEWSLLEALSETDARRILDLCLALDGQSEYVRYYHALLSLPERGSVPAWLRLANDARSSDITGWALLRAANSAHETNPSELSLALIQAASEWIPASVACRFNRLYFALLHGSRDDLFAAAASLRECSPLPADLLRSARRTRWMRLGEKGRSHDFVEALTVMPRELSSAVQESRA